MTHSHFCPLLRGQAEHLWRKRKRRRRQAERRSSSAPLRVCGCVSYTVTSSLSSAQPSGNAALLALQAGGGGGGVEGGARGGWHQPRPSCTISVLFLSLAQCLEAQQSVAEDLLSDCCLFFLIRFLPKKSPQQISVM